MDNYSICFRDLSDKIKAWTWQELLFGLSNNIIEVDDIIDYVNDLILKKNNNDLDSLIEIIIADRDKVESIVKKLASNENKQYEEIIISKWIFLIIYHLYISKNSNINNIIDNIYCDFNYPSDIDYLVSYMPKEDSESQDDKLQKYLVSGKNIWFKNKK